MILDSPEDEPELYDDSVKDVPELYDDALEEVGADDSDDTECELMLGDDVDDAEKI